MRILDLDVRTLVIFIVAIAAISCSHGYRLVVIDGTAMLPSLRNGDRVILEDFPRQIQRGDVVILHPPKDRSKLVVKRVIGLPGEMISIRDGKIFVDDRELKEPYIDTEYNKNGGTFAPIFVQEGNYYVLGDNRDNSSDSRYWGLVDRDLIAGRYYLTYSHAH